MNNQSSQTPTAAPVVYLPVAPQTAGPFHGEQYEDVEDCIDQYVRAAPHNGWTDEQSMYHVYFSLEGTAKHWYENHESGLTLWVVLKSELKRTFANQHRRERAEDLLRTRIQGPNEIVTGFVEDVLR